MRDEADPSLNDFPKLALLWCDYLGQDYGGEHYWARDQIWALRIAKAYLARVKLRDGIDLDLDSLTKINKILARFSKKTIVESNCTEIFDLVDDADDNYEGYLTLYYPGIHDHFLSDAQLLHWNRAEGNGFAKDSPYYLELVTAVLRVREERKILSKALKKRLKGDVLRLDEFGVTPQDWGLTDWDNERLVSPYLKGTKCQALVDSFDLKKGEIGIIVSVYSLNMERYTLCVKDPDTGVERKGLFEKAELLPLEGRKPLKKIPDGRCFITDETDYATLEKTASFFFNYPAFSFVAYLGKGEDGERPYIIKERIRNLPSALRKLKEFSNRSVADRQRIDWDSFTSLWWVVKAIARARQFGDPLDDIRYVSKSLPWDRRLHHEMKKDDQNRDVISLTSKLFEAQIFQEDPSDFGFVFEYRKPGGEWTHWHTQDDEEAIQDVKDLLRGKALASLQ